MSGTPAVAETLARALRAVAGELERDPALARRIAEALRADEPRADERPVAASLPGASAASAPPAADLTPPPPARAGEQAEISARARPPETPTDSASERAQPPAHDEAAEAASRARRGSRSFHPRIITGTPPELGPGVPDPRALRARLGDEGLRAALDELRVGTLRAMVREHHLDPGGRLRGVNDAARLRAAILAAVCSS